MRRSHKHARCELGVQGKYDIAGMGCYYDHITAFDGKKNLWLLGCVNWVAYLLFHIGSFFKIFLFYNGYQ